MKEKIIKIENAGTEILDILRTLITIVDGIGMGIKSQEINKMQGEFWISWDKSRNKFLEAIQEIKNEEENRRAGNGV
jgi:hypothetical protein